MPNYGKANYDKNQSQFQQHTFYQLKSKPTPVVSLVMRLAPPLGAAQERGIWARFIKTHFGVKAKVTKKDGTTAEIPQTYLCVEKTDRNKNVIQECPECTEVTLRKDKLNREEARLKSEGKSDQDIAIALKYQKQWLKEHNLDMKWNIIAKDASGKWGYLKISNKCKKKLDEKIKELVTKGIDPLDPEKGLWLVFKRTDVDSWQDPGDLVEVHTEEDAEGNIKRKYDTFTTSDDEQLDKIDPLATLGRTITVEQIRMLVENPSDEVVKAIFNTSQTRKEESPAPAPTQAPATETVKTTAPAPTAPTQAPAKAEAPAPAVVDDEEAQLEAKLAEARAKKAARAAEAATIAAAAKTSSPAPSATMQQQLDMDMESFISTFETPK